LNLQDFAPVHLADFDRHRPGRSLAAARFGLSVGQAYALQSAVAQLRVQRGEAVAGYKIGCISRTMQNQLGIDRPVFGHIWQSELHASGSVVDAANFDGLAIEGEFAVRLADDVPSAAWLQDNLGVIASGFVVIELHNNVFHDLPANRAVELIANNAIHAGVVLPVEETPLHCDHGLPHAVLRVRHNGEFLGEGTWGSLEGGPLAGLFSLAAHLEQQGRRLQRGQIVLTGSPLPLWPVAAGDRIEVRSEQLGTAAEMSVGRATA
jgi:2-keto-4-pentenoate hydratase